MSSNPEGDKMQEPLEEGYTLEYKIMEKIRDTEAAFEVIWNEPNMSLSEKWDSVSSLVKRRPDCRYCKKLMSR